jgi:hypothetical protein
MATLVLLFLVGGIVGVDVRNCVKVRPMMLVLVLVLMLRPRENEQMSSPDSTILRVTDSQTTVCINYASMKIWKRCRCF